MTRRGFVVPGGPAVWSMALGSSRRPGPASAVGCVQRTGPHHLARRLGRCARPPGGLARAPLGDRVAIATGGWAGRVRGQLLRPEPALGGRVAAQATPSAFVARPPAEYHRA